MNKKYAVFDMDGTLLDSMTFWQRLGREYLAGKGITENADRVLKQVIPMTIAESAAVFISEFSLPGTAESVAAEMNSIMEAHYLSDIPLKPGVKEYLELLQSRGVRMCVASATNYELIKASLKRLGIDRFFDFLLSCEQFGAGKSRPDVYLEAAKRFCAVPQETAVYEDALYALKTAANAGFYTVAVYDDESSEDWEKLTAAAGEAINDWRSAAKEL